MIEFQEREAEARASLKWYGTKKKRPYRIKPETWCQILLFSWLYKYFPAIRAVTFSNGNGHPLNPKTVNVYKSAGLTPVIPDVFMAWPSKFYHGAFYEIKHERGGKPTKEQVKMCELLREQNFYVAITYGFQNSAKAVLRYLYEYGH